MTIVPGQRRGRLWPSLATAALVAATGWTSGCADPEATSGQTPTTPAPYDPAAGATVYPPRDLTAAVPLVVMVPGGSWVSADPSGMAGLAQALSDEGIAVVTVTYRTATDDAFYPLPPQDVACAIAYAAQVATDANVDPAEIVVLGHSVGAQLAALVALQPEEYVADSCEYESVAADRLIGLAGPYDVVAAQGLALNLFGSPPTGPDDWSRGNPVDQADSRPEIPALLIHGLSDALVPVEFTEDFAAALTDGGHEVSAQYPEGVTHASVYSSEVAAEPIAEWLGS